MASRPVFAPSNTPGYLVDEVLFEFPWHPGLAPSQKKKNVNELHAVAGEHGMAPLLEVSSKSETELGRRLSAFSLRIAIDDMQLPLENAFQGSKVFTQGGPYHDLYEAEPGQARRDPRLRDSGTIIGFKLGKVLYPSEPTTGFYDWLYLRALSPHIDYLRSRLHECRGFTDIEFNPEKSINCQARSLALLISLDRSHSITTVVDDYWALTSLFHRGRYWRTTGPAASNFL